MYALLSLSLFVVYGRSLRSPFNFDDVLSVVGNGSIRHLSPLWSSSPDGAPLSPPVNNPTSGRPLVNLSFALNWHFGGENPFGYRIVNLLAHSLAATLLWSIMRRTLRLEFFGGRFAGVADALALMAALAWALHPLQTEPVQYITQRTELLMGLCYLATLSASISYFQAATIKQRRLWLVLASLACAAGMGCKEVMVTAPVMVLLYERTFLAGSLREALRRSLPLYVGLFSSWMVLLALNYGNPRSDSAGFHFDLPAYVWWSTQAKVLLLYLKLVIVPWPLAIHYQFPYLDTFLKSLPWMVPAGLLVLGALVLYWRGTAAGYVGAWVLIILSPTLVVPIVTEVAAERRMYLPLAGIVALLVSGGFALCVRSAARHSGKTGRQRSPGRRPVLVVACCSAAVAVVLGGISARRLAVFQSNLALWQDAVVSQPESSFAQSNLGNELINNGRPEEAIEHLELALRLPHFHEANIEYSLGTALAMSGRPAEGIPHLETSVKLKPNVARTHGNLAQALVTVGRREEALQHFAEALRLEPATAPPVEHGRVLVELGRPQEAIAVLNRTVQQRPDIVDAHRELGIAYAMAGHPQEACKALQYGLRFAPPTGPSPAELHRLLGVFTSQDNLPVAVTHFEQAVRLSPDDPSLKALLRDARERLRQSSTK